MADINKVVLVGRLTRDAELKYTQGGFAITNFSLAVNRRKKQGDEWVDEASFFDCQLLGKSAESLKQYLTRGKQVAIDGRLQQDRWESNGEHKSRVVIVCDNVELFFSNSGAEPQAQSREPQAQYKEPNFSDFPEDLPF